MSYSIIGMGGIDSFDYVLLFKIHLWIAVAGYKKIHFYSISESSWDNFDYMICPLSEPRRHVFALSYREEPSIIYFISRL